MSNERRQKVFVGMSGGVDSSVAALLLKEQGFDVTGVHIKMWSDPDIPCAFKEDRYDAMRAAAHLDIPFTTWDLTQEYREAVVEYMIREYAAGRTPNPDVMCNRYIKFGVFLGRAIEAGADFVATGHYVKIKNENIKVKNESVELSSRRLCGSWQNHDNEKFRNEFKLLKAKDLNKDQSYFLWTLTQDQLEHCLYPIGEYTKPEVREMAKKAGLPTAEKPDSQGICFIGEIDIRKFLKKHILTRPGLVRTTSGKVVGEHDGLSFYTIGQRRGIGVGGGVPYYAAEKDFVTNTLIVAEGPYDDALFAKKLVVRDIHWISGNAPELPLTCETRIRYRQPVQEARIMNHKSCMENAGNAAIHNSLFMIQFSEPQRAVTPGQSIVFYQGDEMLGGGIIE